MSKSSLTVSALDARVDAIEGTLVDLTAAVKNLAAAVLGTPVTAKVTAPVTEPKAAKAAKKGKKAAKVTATEAKAAKVDPAKRKEANKAKAAWMREHGLVPVGQAWVAVGQGERSVPKLRALNVLDGYEPKGVTAKGSKAVTAAIAALTEPEPEKSDARAEAAKRSAAAKQRDERGRFVPKVVEAPKPKAAKKGKKGKVAASVTKAEPAQVAKPKNTSEALAAYDQEKVATLREAGLSDGQIMSALATL